MRLIIVASHPLPPAATNTAARTRPSPDPRSAPVGTMSPQRALDALIAAANASGAFDDTVVVTGADAALVEPVVHGNARHGAAVRTLFNPFHATSGTAMSLWLARAEFNDDVVVVDRHPAIWPETLVRLVAQAGDGFTIAIDLSTCGGGPSAGPNAASIRGRRARGLVLDQLELLGRDPAAHGVSWQELFGQLPARPLAIAPTAAEIGATAAIAADPWEVALVH